MPLQSEYLERGMNGMYRYVMLGVLGFMSGVANGQGRGGPPPAHVVIDPIVMEELVERRVVTGEIRSRLRSRVASQVEGLMVSMLVEEGDLVARGDVIARLDDVRAQIQFHRAMADVDFAAAVMMQREAELEVARRDLARLEELTRLGSSGISQLDEAKTLVKSREALMAQAKAELVSAKGDLALREREVQDMTIRAPFAGRIESKESDVGEWVGRGDPIVLLVSISELEVLVNIPEAMYASVVSSANDGGEIELVIPALSGMIPSGRVFGKIIAVLPQADSLSRLFAVRIGVSAKGEDGTNLLRPGMSVSAWVPTGKPGRFITVSKDAIVRSATGEVVYFVDDGKSALAPITRLFAVGNRVAVRSPMLREGMSVVVDGNERLYPGRGLQIHDKPNDDIVGGGE